MARRWTIDIPVRPKAVQSVRYSGRGGKFHPDPKVKAWKAAITPYIERAMDGPPSEKPIRVAKAIYEFKLPKSAKKALREAVQRGEVKRYDPRPDLDNLGKGVWDECEDRIFVDDKQICEYGLLRKVYSLRDGMQIVLEELDE